MTYDEFQRQIGKAGLTIREFADLVKMHRNSVTNYAKLGVGSVTSGGDCGIAWRDGR